MRLRCTIGSMHILSRRTVYNRGDEFEMEATKAASLISSGYAVTVEEIAVEPVKEPEAEPVEGHIETTKPTPKRSRSHKR
ncbi:hypothetical protein Metho_1223 [Methanomethylovorans hollandica DSM 15978]|uniref:Uncharacterized protein n=2 Tax=Methanomethylovorans hollandica TaxID=101192 RepID=L0KZD2_METHD|nr:hypothetical protein Metho_1223 [Methanomethylovorans hollandica DSM 15978]